MYGGSFVDCDTNIPDCGLQYDLHTYNTYMHTYIHTYNHTYINIYIHTYIHTQIQTDNSLEFQEHKVVFQFLSVSNLCMVSKPQLYQILVYLVYLV